MNAKNAIAVVLSVPLFLALAACDSLGNLFVNTVGSAYTTAVHGPFVHADTGGSFSTGGNVQDDHPDSPNCVMQPASGTTCSGKLDRLGSSAIGGFGVGWRFANGLWADVTYANRSGFNLRGTDPAGTDFDPQVTSNSVMANGYYDLPVVLGPVRPFVGAGVGVSHNEMDPLRWNDPGCCSGVLTGGTTTDVAWQLTAGASVAIVGGWSVAVGYRYVDLGEIKKDAGPDQAGLFGTGVTDSMTGDLRANEVFFSLIYAFGSPGP